MPWGQSDPSCGIARQKVKRERENYPGKSPNLRHFLAHSQNKGLSTRELAGCALAGDREACGGSQSQKGTISAPEGHPLQNRKQAPICLPRLLGILGGWHSQGGSQLGISSPEETHGIPETGTPAATQETEWLGWRRWKDAPHLRVTVLAKPLLAWAARTEEGHKRQVQPSLSLCGVPEKQPEPEWLRPGKCTQSRAHLRQFQAEQPGAWAV